ncbi:MAG: polyamine aminopropyltransferase [Syntrophomonadaceae bacterium]|nr:polyamine aminopropyltransferase [Syntrophomonadaceae bacterium]
MDIWMEENHTDGYRVNWKISELLWREQTPFQELMIVDMFDFGKALILDGAVQTTEQDEFIYHEMISHVALNAHPDPAQVLIIGGGDGGTLREVLKHPGVVRADMVEIDQRVVETCKRFLPGIASGFGDPRAQLYFEDGARFVKKTQGQYDVVIVDSSDPTGPAVELYGPEFYRDCFGILKDDGIMVAHAESPTFFTAYFKAVWRNMEVFPRRNVYLTTVPTYVSGFWAFAIGSKKHDPSKARDDKHAVDGLKCYTRDVHGASFVLPPFIQKIIDQV